VRKGISSMQLKISFQTKSLDSRWFALGIGFSSIVILDRYMRILRN